MSSKNTTSRKEKKSLIIGSVVAVFIAISPYIFYLYESFPKGVYSTEILGINIQSRFEIDLNTQAWLFFSKFVPLYLFILWFFTCKHWWYHVLLIPIAMYVFQTFSAINDNIQYTDEFEIFLLIPIMMIVIPMVYLIRIKLFDRFVYGIDLRKIDEELEKYDALEQELEREVQFYDYKKNT
ncbi:hypothetical protein IS446_12240 [Robertkochia sp. 1368]|nr:hypothetical protein [Robertkochia sediminum]